MSTLRLPLRATLALCLIASAAAAQPRAPKADEEPAPLLTAADAPGIILTVVILLGIPIAVYIYQRRKVTFPNDAVAEAQFEREAMLQVRATASTPAPAAADHSRPAEGGFLASPHIARAPGFDQPGWSQRQTAIETPPAEAVGGIVVESPIGLRPAAPAALPAPPPSPAAVPPVGIDAPPSDINELVRRLQALGVLGEVEGRVAMAIPPDGLIVRVRKTRGVALVMPRFESEAVMAHHTRRFDMVFALTAAGEVLVLSRLQTRLTELLEIKG